MANPPPPVGDRAPELPPGKVRTVFGARTDPGTDQILSWGWFLIILVIAAQLPEPAPAFVRVTLVLVLLYLGLTNTDKLARLSRRFTGGLT